MNPRKRALLIAAAMAAALSACGGEPQFPLTLGTARASVHGDRRSSWMDSSAKNGSLLYVSDSVLNDVYVYTYPKLRLVGTLTGFAQPEGACVDAVGDVWIANYGTAQIIEYAHGATQPKATLDDPNNFPYACAIDPTTGDLAVVNFAHNPVPGSLSIYRKGKGQPHVYIDDSLYVPFFDGYDSRGKLFVDGIRGFYYPYFALVTFYNKTFTNIELNHSINDPGGIVAVGSRLNIGDAFRYTHVVYGFTIKGLKGRLIGTTPLLGTAIVQNFTIAGKSLLAANVDQTIGSEMVFRYPTGGSPERAFGTRKDSGPVGIVVSQ